VAAESAVSPPPSPVPPDEVALSDRPVPPDEVALSDRPVPSDQPVLSAEPVPPDELAPPKDPALSEELAPPDEPVFPEEPGLPTEPAPSPSAASRSSSSAQTVLPPPPTSARILPEPPLMPPSWSSTADFEALPSARSTSTTQPAVPALTTWTIVVGTDRTYYDSMRAKSAISGPPVTFPDDTNERRFSLAGKQMRIGRRSVTRDLEPEIDLAEPPTDPGISRLHAVLIAASDGTWAVLDPGSANGTLLNGREIATGDLITLHDGDRINLGAWTVITVHRD
jgi:hypothetical protein